MRRNRDSKIRIDMFPFLSVLCTVIGVMMLLIVLVVSTRAEKAQQQAQQSASPVSMGLSEEESEEISDEVFAQLESQLARLQETLKKRTSEHDLLKHQILKLEELLAIKEDALINQDDPRAQLTGIDLDPPEQVKLVPLEEQEQAAPKQARFVEIRSDELVAHPNSLHANKEVFSVSQVFDTRSRFHQFLQETDRARDDEYLLLLIHPNGTEVYKSVMKHLVIYFPAEDLPSRIDIGKEPFHKDWLLINQ